MARFVPDLALIKSYEQLLLISSSISFFYVSGLGQAVIPFYEKQTIAGKDTLFISMFYLLLIGGILSATALSCYAFYFEKNSLSTYTLFAIFTAFNVPSFAVENYFLAHKQQVSLFTWGIVIFSLQILCFLVPLLIFSSLNLGIIGLISVAFCKLIYTCYRLKVFVLNTKLKNQILSLLSYSWPVVLTFVIGGSSLYVHAFIVEYFLTPKEFVLYRYGAREFPLFLIIANSFSLIYSAKISKSTGQDKLEETLLNFKLKTKKVLHQLFPLAIGLMISSSYLFKLFYSDLYFKAFLVFNVLLLLLLSRTLFPQTILFGLGKTKQFMYASLLELIIGTSLSLVMVENHRLIGVSIALVIAFLFEKLFLIATCYYYNTAFFKYFPWKTYLFYATLLTGTFLVANFVH